MTRLFGRRPGRQVRPMGLPDVPAEWRAQQQMHNVRHLGWEVQTRCRTGGRQRP